MIEYTCPIDQTPLQRELASLYCVQCKNSFPIINGIPILINEKNSVFRIGDYVIGESYGGASEYSGSLDDKGGLRRLYRNLAACLSSGRRPNGPPIDPITVVREKISNPRILVIGCGEKNIDSEAVYTDVVLSPHVHCVCDAHDIPFADESFDAVFADAVLEHVCDPQRCVSEFYRVLKPEGYVYANTPFLQPVHMGAHDFTRFTRLGHRRLFRFFDEVESGMSRGPAYSVIHLICGILPSTTDRIGLQRYLRAIALLLTFPLKYLDSFLSRTVSSNNVACGFYFIGIKRIEPVDDRTIITFFQGV